MRSKLFILMIFAFSFAVCKAWTPEVLAPEVVTVSPSSEASGDANADDLLEENELAPNFTLPDVNGNMITLADLRGQYVVLDFWGTWCGWCVKAMPKMKEYYDKYQGKFEIVGIDCGDPPIKWKAAVQVLKLPWINVQVGRDNLVSRIYRVKSFPTKVIIDPSGNIVKIVSGEDPKFYKILEKLFD